MEQDFEVMEQEGNFLPEPRCVVCGVVEIPLKLRTEREVAFLKETYDLVGISYRESQFGIVHGHCSECRRETPEDEEILLREAEPDPIPHAPKVWVWVSCQYPRRIGQVLKRVG